MWENRVWSLGREDTLEKEMAIHSSILAWKIPWTEEPGGLQSMGSQRVVHDWAINTFFHGSRHIQLISISNAFFFCQCLCKVLFSLGHLIFLIPHLPLSGWFLHLLKISVLVSFSAWYSSSIDRVKYPCHGRSACLLVAFIRCILIAYLFVFATKVGFWGGTLFVLFTSETPVPNRQSGISWVIAVASDTVSEFRQLMSSSDFKM